jgi:hypothetical protein
MQATRQALIVSLDFVVLDRVRPDVRTHSPSLLRKSRRTLPAAAKFTFLLERRETAPFAGTYRSYPTVRRSGKELGYV